jgi:hypothetical protein
MEARPAGIHIPPVRSKFLRWVGDSGAVQGKCLLPGGLQGCYL